MLKLNSPDVSGWDKPGSYWLAWYGPRCVRNRHGCSDVADNTQHHIIKGYKHTTDHA